MWLLDIGAKKTLATLLLIDDTKRNSASGARILKWLCYCSVLVMICWQKFSFFWPTCSHLCMLNVESNTEYFSPPSNRLFGWKFPLFILSIVLISIIAWWNVEEPYSTVKLSKNFAIPLVWTSQKKCDRIRHDLVWSISSVYTVAQNFHEQWTMVKKFCVTEPDGSSH